MCRGDIDGEAAGLLKVMFHHEGRLGPDGMVVLAIDDAEPDFIGSGEKAGSGKGEECSGSGDEGVLEN